MIKLTRINGSGIFLNSLLIRSLEEAGDTVVMLLTGERILVKESVQEVLQILFDHKRQLYEALEGTQIV